MTTHAEWIEAQAFERGWWGAEICLRWIGEQHKQRRYAQLMGMPANLDFGTRRILDVGCGPVSLLLISQRGPSVGVEPLPLSQATLATYAAQGVTIMRQQGEDMDAGGFDEAWCYNVLQHVERPRAVLVGLAAAAPVVRLFEWLHTPPSAGHPNTLDESMFSETFAGWKRETWNVGTLDEPLLCGDYIAATVRRMT